MNVPEYCRQVAIDRGLSEETVDEFLYDMIGDDDARHEIDDIATGWGLLGDMRVLWIVE